MKPELPCWTQIARPSLFFNFYLYFDTEDSLADRLLSDAKLRGPIQKKEFENSKYEYRMVFCRVCKMDSKKFAAALNRLPDKMLLCGHRDYISFCQTKLSKMKGIRR